MKNCPNCGAPVNPGDRFCQNCGYDLSKVQGWIDQQNSNSSGYQPEASSGLTCPNCGAPVKPNDHFCQNCGYDLTQAVQQPVSKESRPVQRSVQNSAPKPVYHDNHTEDHQNSQPLEREERRHPRKKSKRFWIITSIIVVILVLADGYLFAAQKYSKQHQVDQMVSDIALQSKARVVQDMVSNDPKLVISSSSVAPFLTYANSHHEYLYSMRADLVSTGQTKDGTFKLVTEGRTVLFFPDYKIQAISMNPQVSINAANVSLNLNGKPVPSSSEQEQGKWNLGPLFPGTYNFSYQNGSQTTSKTVDLLVKPMPMSR